MIDLGSNLPSLLCTLPTRPKVLKILKHGNFCVYTSFGHLNSMALKGDLLTKYVVVANASPQNCFGNHAPTNIHITLFNRLLFILSTTMFCCGVCLTVLCLKIPFSSQNLSNSLLQNSRPLSVLSTFRVLLVWFSINIFHALNLSKVLD